jgi:hypothetical protein
VFSRKVVERKLDSFEAKNKWRPVQHSVEECDRMAKHLNSEGPNGVIYTTRTGVIELARELKKWEADWIRNERLMCAISCEYYLTRYYMITSEAEDGAGNVMHFVFRSGQRVFYNILEELDDMGVSKEIFCLKARKQGISTLIEGILSWFSLFIPGSKAAIASADGQKSQIMAGMFFFAIDELPWWLESERTRDKRASDRGIIEWSHIGNQVILQSGSMRGGIGQGTTPNVVHISEASQYTNAVKQIDEGLLKAVTSAPGNFMVIETTGDGDKWTADMWNNCKDNYWSGGARLLPLFLPWFMTPELYPSKSWILKYKIPEGWAPIPETQAMTLKCDAYVACTEMLRRVLGEAWKLPAEQKWYWEFNFLEHRRRGLEKSWTRQMPCDDFEALIGDRDKIIPEETVTQMEKTKKSVANTPVYMVAGDGISTKHEPIESMVWYGEDSPPRLKCNWKTKSQETLEWMFVPLLPAIYAGMHDRVRASVEKTFDPLEKCLIWKEPEDGYDYAIGWDTGTGVGGDRSVISVNRKGLTDAEPDEQVAEFASDAIALQDIAWFAAPLAALYSKYMKDKPHPKICIEMKRKYGDGPYHELKTAGFRRWHEWGSNFDVKVWREKVGKHGRIGWFTNEWSRPLLLSRFFGAVENGWYIVRSKWLAQELAEMEQKVTESGKTRADHEAGKHDDRVFAAAMSYFTLHQSDVMAERMKKRYDAPGDEGLVIEHGPATGMPTMLTGGSLWPAR